MTIRLYLDSGVNKCDFIMFYMIYIPWVLWLWTSSCSLLPLMRSLWYRNLSFLSCSNITRQQPDHKDFKMRTQRFFFPVCLAQELRLSRMGNSIWNPLWIHGDYIKWVFSCDLSSVHVFQIISVNWGMTEASRSWFFDGGDRILFSF